MHRHQNRRNTFADTHAIERLDQRVTAEEAKVALSRCAKAAAQYSGSVAVICHTLNQQRGQAWGQKSNGDLVIGIIRGGHLKTVFLRRSTQTNTTSSLRVDRLVNMTGTEVKGIGLAAKKESRNTPYNPFI